MHIKKTKIMNTQKVDFKNVIGIVVVLAGTLYFGISTYNESGNFQIIDIKRYFLLIGISIVPLILYFTNRKQNISFLRMAIFLFIIFNSIYFIAPFALFVMFFTGIIMNIFIKGKLAFLKETKQVS